MGTLDNVITVKNYNINYYVIQQFNFQKLLIMCFKS